MLCGLKLGLSIGGALVAGILAHYGYQAGASSQAPAAVDGIRMAVSLYSSLPFLVCVALSVVAMALPPSWRDPIASGLRRTVLAPFLALQEQSLQLQTSRARLRAMEEQRDSAALAATFLPALRAENERLRAMVGIKARFGSAAVAAEVLHQAEPTSPLTLVISAGRRDGSSRLSEVAISATTDAGSQSSSQSARMLNWWCSVAMAPPGNASYRCHRSTCMHRRDGRRMIASLHSNGTAATDSICVLRLWP